MYTKKADQKLTVRENVMGGKGEILSRHFLDADNAAGSGRLFAVTTIAPGCSIGRHTHEGEFEIYYILSGTARITDDADEYTLGAGDIQQCRSGHSHGVENIGRTPLELIAVILNERE